MDEGRRAGGRIAVRVRGEHGLVTPAGRIDVSHRNLRLLQRGDGYNYAKRDDIVERSLRKSA